MWSEETILMKTTLKDEKTPATCRERKRVLGARRRLHQDPEAGQRCLFLKMTRRFGRCSKGTCTSIIELTAVVATIALTRLVCTLPITQPICVLQS